MTTPASLIEPEPTRPGTPPRRRWQPFWPYPLAFAALLVIGHVAGDLADIDRELNPHDLDHRVSTWVSLHRPEWPRLTDFFLAVTQLGDPWVATTAVLAIALGLFYLHRKGLARITRGEALFWLAVAGGGRCLSYLLKLWFRRERPPVEYRLVEELSYSFPSGHSVFSACFFTLAAILLVRSLRGLPRGSCPVLVATCLFVAVLISASRIWLGVHYLSDVVGGFLLGLSWSLTACLIRFGWPRPAPHSPDA